MKTTELTAKINAHIDSQLEAISQDTNDELKEVLRGEALAIVTKELDCSRVVRVARRLLNAKLAGLRAPSTAAEKPAQS